MKRGSLRRVVVLACGLSIAAAGARADAPPKTTDPRPLGAHLGTTYPADALRLVQEGDVIVSFTIGVDGKVSNPSVVQSSGFKSLDDAALASVVTWLYVPATVNGKPVAAPWKAVVKFRLEDSDMTGRPFTVVEMQASDVPAGVTVSQETSTWLYAVIDENGSLVETELVRTSGTPALDQAALSRVVRFRFTPAALDGKPVRTVLMFDVHWPGNPPPQLGPGPAP